MRWVKHQVKDDFKEFKGQLNVVFTAPMKEVKQRFHWAGRAAKNAEANFFFQLCVLGDLSAMSGRSSQSEDRSGR